VLTLVHSDKKRVHGIAYKIGKNVEEAFERLNFREKCGYSIKKLVFYKGHDDKSESLDCICYFANEDNPYFKPEEDLNRLAVQIYESVGPSGTNKEYLYKFCDALRNTVADENELKNDLEIFALEKLVRSLEN
jgi:cation transport protein ChaC